METPRTIKGFADLFEPESTLYSTMERIARRVFSAYGYHELRVPILEYTELFARSIGTETDVVQKEMFTMPDRKGRSLTMRPEATAGTVRAFIEHNCHAREGISKFFTYGPMFRYERPQKGRMRQFHQINCECFGVEEPELDAEVILMLTHFLSELGLTELSLEINSLGCRDCRPKYKETLLTFLRTLDSSALCEDCRRRMETSPMRVLDCKIPGCKALTESAPRILDNLCEPCDTHFATVLGIIKKADVPHVLNPRLVRGLDYYSRTTFEIVSSSIGSQGSVAGGGRYDGLVAQMGGPDVPGIGFACGMERLALMLQASIAEESLPRPDFYIAVLAPEASQTALAAAQTLRKEGLSGEVAFTAKSLKSQMRQASRNRAQFCLLFGETELAAGEAVIKNMDSGEQASLPLTELKTWAQNNRP